MINIYGWREEEKYLRNIKLWDYEIENGKNIYELYSRFFDKMP